MRGGSVPYGQPVIEVRLAKKDGWLGPHSVERQLQKASDIGTTDHAGPRPLPGPTRTEGHDHHFDLPSRGRSDSHTGPVRIEDYAPRLLQGHQEALREQRLPPRPDESTERFGHGCIEPRPNALSSAEPCG